MIHQIFKLIWKKKQRNFLMMLEIFLAFMVLFAVAALSVYQYKNYKNPSGIDIDNVWVAYLNYNTDTMPNIEMIRRRLESYPELASYSFTGNNVPFSFSSANTSIDNEGRTGMTEIMNVEPSYPAVLNMRLIEGSWFTWADTISKNAPIVITRKLKETLFGDEPAVGKICNENIPESDDPPTGYKIVGVVDYFKHTSDYQEDEACMFVPGNKWSNSTLLLRWKTPQNADFEARLSKDLASINKDWSIEVQHLDLMKETKNKFILVPILILFIVCGFLVFNVALGLFGVLFQNISQRKSEIGVRRAMGATQKSILLQIMGETAMIATFGLILGLFFAVQFPLLHIFDLSAGIYITAMLLAMAAVYLLVAVCSFYPSKQASRIFPAEALREE